MAQALGPQSMFEDWWASATGQERRVQVPGRPEPFANRERIDYWTRLAEPRRPGEDIAILHLNGLYAHAEIDVEGRLDGDGPVTHDAYFEPVRVPFLPDWETEIRVTCNSPRDRFGGTYDTALVADERAVPGIWWDATVETGTLPYLDSVRVHPEYDDDGISLHVRTAILTDGPTEQRITYSVRPEGRSHGGGTMERTAIEATESGRTTVEHTIRLRSPSCWSPYEVGSQHRHVLRAKFGDQERTVTFGIRKATFNDGAIQINGETVPIRGVNLLDATPEDIERALGVNANLVRFCGHVPSPAVYEACDEAGMLVWQDIPLTGPGPFDVDRGRALARVLARRAARHPSVVAYAVHDEPVAVADGLGSGLLDRLRLRWQAWRADYDDGPAKSVAEMLPEPTFPAVGGPGLGCHAGAYYPGWRYGAPDDTDRLLARYPVAVVAAYGAPASDREERASTETLSPEKQRQLLRTVTGTLRRERIGAIPFCLRDCTDDSFGVYAADGTPKPSRDALAQVFEPTQAFLSSPTADTSPVVIVNDRPREIVARLEWAAGDSNGDFDVTVGPDDVWAEERIRIPRTADRVELRLTGEAVSVENSYER